MKHSFKTYGKWILAGEHSVLRGTPAIAFPLKNCYLDLTYEKTSDPFDLSVTGHQNDQIELILWGILSKALDKKNLSRSDLKGVLQIKSCIAMGRGLGASSTLCVSVARLFTLMELIDEEEIPRMACDLESIFHGESSGLDIAAVMSETGILYHRSPHTIETVTLNWQPQWYLSDSGDTSMTEDCIGQVKQYNAQHPHMSMDTHMQNAVQKARQAIEAIDPQVELLAEAINQAGECFQNWGLVSGALETHITEIKSQGAIAAKPTGAGRGGYVLSLWQKPPPASLSQSWLKL